MVIKTSEQEIEYEQELFAKDISSKLFESDNLIIGRVGDSKRWYKGVGNQEFDGDSLYVQKDSDSPFQLIDGFNLNDVGLFHVYGDTFREFNGDIMVAYFKQRELSKENREIKVKLLTHTKEGIKIHNLFGYRLNSFLTMPTKPEVAVSDPENKLSITHRIVEPHSMSFSDGPREDLKTLILDLEKYNINLDSVINPEISISEAKNLVNFLGPSLGMDDTYDPKFPENRKDVCAVRRLAENGNWGYDTIYLLWKGKNGKLKHEELTNSSDSGSYLSYMNIFEKDKKIIINVGKNGFEFTKTKKELGISI